MKVSNNAPTHREYHASHMAKRELAGTPWLTGFDSTHADCRKPNMAASEARTRPAVPHRTPANGIARTPESAAPVSNTQAVSAIHADAEDESRVDGVGMIWTRVAAV
jgi:hypothetical protein